MDARDERFVVDSPVGRLKAELDEAGRLCRLTWTQDAPAPPRTAAGQRLAEQLARYFAGALDRFDIETHAAGSAFQRAVWEAMCAIPYGETRTYGQLGAIVGAPARAVGGACGENPIPVVVPCHRVLAADGLGGYSGRGGLRTKRALLALEGVRLPAEQLALPLG